MTNNHSSTDSASFSAPPVSYTDRSDRAISIQEYSEDYEELVAMYEQFDSADRAQGIPPAQERQIRRWLDSITKSGPDVVALHDDRIIGHATLVPDPESEAHELAIFVLSEYQGAGIGTKLLETLLGAGKEDDIAKVWLSVERWNSPAIAIYEKAGFERIEGDSLELKMELELDG